MRVLHVVPSYYPALRYGGTILAVHDLASSLASLGHDVEVFTTDRDGPGRSGVPVETPVLRDGVKITYFRSRMLPRLYVAPAMGRALAARVKTFDIVLVHSVFLWPTTTAARKARAAGVPYIAFPHGMLVKSLVKARNSVLKKAWIWLFERQNYEWAAAIRVTSTVEKAELERFGWRLPGLLTISNPTNLPEPYEQDDVAPDVLGIVKRQPLILYFGRLNWKKGIDRLIESLAWTPQGELAIAGTDDENLAPGLAALARRIGVAGRVVFLPRTLSGADKEHLFRAATLFVLTSLNENFGNTVLEAMARGIPVLVTPDVGASEIVRETGAGVVVPGDPETIGTAIGDLLDDPGTRRRMGAAGTAYCRSKGSGLETAAALSAAMEQIVARGRYASSPEAMPPR